MIAVHVGDKDTANLAGLEVAFEELVLGAFATVKQPHFGTLRETKGYAGDVAGAGGYAGAGS